jgi:hypothetical protein
VRGIELSGAEALAVESSMRYALAGEEVQAERPGSGSAIVGLADMHTYGLLGVGEASAHVDAGVARVTKAVHMPLHCERAVEVREGLEGESGPVLEGRIQRIGSNGYIGGRSDAPKCGKKVGGTSQRMANDGLMTALRSYSLG